MTRKLYFGRPWREPGYPHPWISFEDSPEFALTGAKSKFCQACLRALRNGLLSYQQGQAVNVGPGADCWKAVVGIESVKNPEDARRLLEDNQQDFLSADTGIHGKVGGGEMPAQQQIMIDCDSPLQAEICKETMKRWLRKHHNNPLNSYYTQQGCKHPFLELFGPVAHRDTVMKPRSPQAVKSALELYLSDAAISSLNNPPIGPPDHLPNA